MMVTNNLKRRNWCAESVPQCQWGEVLRTVLSMAKILSSLNANSVVQSPSGSVGETPISVSHVTRLSAMVTTCRGSQRISYRSVQARRSVV